MITSFGEERANLSAFRTFVLFVLVWICRFPLPRVRVFLGLNHLDHWTWTGPSDYQLDQMGCISWTNSSWTKS